MEHGFDLAHLVALLGAAVIAVPIFKRLGLGSVLGYLAAGLVIGPFGFGLFRDPQSIVHTAELGVVMLLFVIGLEMKPSRLWALRREILGLGASQVVACAALLTVLGIAAGFDPAVAFIAGSGFVMTSTAVVLQMLEERGEANTPFGQKAISILLLEDLAIVPLLAAVAALSGTGEGGPSGWVTVATGAGAIVAVIAAGRWLLTPLFGLFAAARAREIMTAAALLVVLGAALLLEAGGLSMAMGAFLAGVMLSDSSFRHQLEADIEPFRGILMGLFFLAVGMSLDLAVIGREWLSVAALVAVLMVAKAAGIYAIARLFRSSHSEALRRAVLFAQGGEFAFVLYTTALDGGVIDGETAAMLNAAVIISMALTPLMVLAQRRLMPPSAPSMDGIEAANGLTGTVLVIGFGRFGQIASQALLARGVDVAIIDNDPDMIRAAARFGFKVYYGDGTRLDVLRAAGAERAVAIAVCIDVRDDTNRIVEVVHEELPLAKLLVRSYDRGHTIALREAGVDYEIRETFESAMAFGFEALKAIGVEDGEAAAVMADVRRRDAERLRLQIAGGIMAGSDLMRGGAPVPGPLTPPRRQAQPLNEEARVANARATGEE